MGPLGQIAQKSDEEFFTLSLESMKKNADLLLMLKKKEQVLIRLELQQMAQGITRIIWSWGRIHLGLFWDMLQFIMHHLWLSGGSIVHQIIVIITVI